MGGRPAGEWVDDDPGVGHEVIYKGATRPPLVLGVPLVPAVCVLAGASVTAVPLGYYVSWWIALVIAIATATMLAAMYAVTKHDDQRLHQHSLQLRLSLRNRNRSFWRCRSYSPVVYEGCSEDSAIVLPLWLKVLLAGALLSLLSWLTWRLFLHVGAAV
jgi:type IV secretion system protein VirB3